MAIYSIDDGQRIINDFNAEKDIVEQSWDDRLGKKYVMDLTEVSQIMASCLGLVQSAEGDISACSDQFLWQCGCTEPAFDIPESLGVMEKLLCEVNNLISMVTEAGTDDDSEGGRHASGTSGAEDKKSEDEQKRSNLIGTTMAGGYGGAFPENAEAEADTDEIEKVAVKVKRR